jgi:lipoate-protein ligase B
MNRLYVVDLGLVKYDDALRIQENAVERRFRNEIPDTLFLLEHYPVFTIGTLARDASEDSIFKIPVNALREKGIDIVRVKRGGHVTYHCPGQLIGYPIRKLNSQKEIGRHVNGLEQAMIATAKEFGIAAFKKGVEYDPRTGKKEKFKGAWYRTGGIDSKLGAIGAEIVAKDGEHVTRHGLAFYVSADMEPFQWVDPCGLKNIGVTSLEAVLRKKVPMEEVKRKLTANFSSYFQYTNVELKDLKEIIQ